MGVGDFAKKLREKVEEMCAELDPPVAVEFVETKHPAATGPQFFEVNVFAEVKAAIQK